MKEWDWEANAKLGLDPSKISSGSEKKVFWLCAKGHRWIANVYNRIKGRGCPICSNKKVLKGYNDLETINPELAQEWNYDKNHPLLPTQITSQSNKKVWWKCKKGHEWQATICSRNSGLNCPVCSNQKILVGYNDLATTNPELVKEWNYEKNAPLLPTQVFEKSGKKVWWRCKKGHEWQATISHRNLGEQCPVCVGKKTQIGENDIFSTRPNLKDEWDYEKNNGVNPLSLPKGSHTKVWWKCSKCGHEWKAEVRQRVKGLGKCPKCAKKQLDFDFE